MFWEELTFLLMITWESKSSTLSRFSKLGLFLFSLTRDAIMLLAIFLLRKKRSCVFDINSFRCFLSRQATLSRSSLLLFLWFRLQRLSSLLNLRAWTTESPSKICILFFLSVVRLMVGIERRLPIYSTLGTLMLLELRAWGPSKLKFWLVKAFFRLLGALFIEIWGFLDSERNSLFDAGPEVLELRRKS